MSIEIINVEQNTPAWHQARCGIPTASRFSDILAKGRTAGAPSLTRRKYLLQLAGEIISGEPMETFCSPAMERGKAMEDEARLSYALMEDVDPIRIGFVRNGNVGCSPDSFIGDNGMLEIKTAAPHILIEHLLAGEFPSEHKAQCQGALWVCEREWIDLYPYWPKMPNVKFRAFRDDAYIANLAGAVAEFNDDLAAIVEKVRHHGLPIEDQAITPLAL